MIKYCLCVLSVSVIFFTVFQSPAAFAEEKSVEELKKEKIFRLLSLTRTPEIYVKTLLDMIKQSPLAPEDKDLYSKHAKSESLAEAFVPVYMETFTDEEIDAMIDFYSSPSGVSVVEKTPEMIARLRKINFEWEALVAAKVKSEKAQKAVEKDK